VPPSDRRQTWTEAMDARLAVLWAEGHTAGVIAQEFRRSRNAVIGESSQTPSPRRGRRRSWGTSRHCQNPRRPRCPSRRSSWRRRCGASTAASGAGVPGAVRGSRASARTLRCDAPVWGNTSWCREHYRRCYQRLPVAAHALGHWTRG
jgi:hypothetical protein